MHCSCAYYPSTKKVPRIAQCHPTLQAELSMNFIHGEGLNVFSCFHAAFLSDSEGALGSFLHHMKMQYRFSNSSCTRTSPFTSGVEQRAIFILVRQEIWVHGTLLTNRWHDRIDVWCYCRIAIVLQAGNFRRRCGGNV